MGKSLVIVESPAKAKTINKYLGNDFIVKSSIGHIRDLPTSGSSKAESKPKGKKAASAPELDKETKARMQLVKRMGVDPENGWKAHYEILPGKEKVVDELRRLARDADAIYLATDLDREGEAIAWHLRESIGGDDARYKRVVFNEITKKAIQEAFSKPGELDINRVNAQQARRFLDRVVGYMVSPLLWQKIARGLSAGRVQSVAVKLIVDREREIRAFVPEEFWEIHALLGTPKAETVRFEVVRENGETFRPLNKEQTDKAIEYVASKADERFYLWVHYYDPHYDYETHEGVGEFGTSKIDEYDHEIAFTDQHIGRLLDDLKARGLYDKTVIVVTGDFQTNTRPAHQPAHGGGGR